MYGDAVLGDLLQVRVQLSLASSVTRVHEMLLAREMLQTGEILRCRRRRDY
jgi:hypothetical protein